MLKLYESSRKENGINVRKGDLDLDTEKWNERIGNTTVTKYEAWRGDTTKVKKHVDDVVKELEKNYSNKTFIEKLGTEEVKDDSDQNSNNTDEVPDVNKQYKRYITYTLNN